MTLSLPGTAALRRNLGRARHRLEGDRRVVGALKPKGGVRNTTTHKVEVCCVHSFRDMSPRPNEEGVMVWHVPVEAPVAAGLERRGEVVAVALGVDAAVPVAPAV